MQEATTNRSTTNTVLTKSDQSSTSNDWRCHLATQQSIRLHPIS